MRFSARGISRGIFAISVILVTLLVATHRSGAAVSVGHGSALLPLASPTPNCNSPVYCYEIVNINSSDYNYVTGIDNSQQIVGAYSSTSGGTYTGFLGVPTAQTQNQLTAYSLSSERDGSLSTYLGGLDDGSGNNIYQVGFVVQGLLPLPQGAVLFPGGSSWGIITDPNQGTGSCAVTELTAIHDSRIAVGFYETNGTGSTCVKHAFEVYSNGTFSSPYTFVDLAPADPSGSTLDVTSSEATGINILGDIVGNVTWTGSGGNPQTGGWIYRALKYTTFCYGGTSKLTTSSCNITNAYPTFANGINFSDVVVGNFTDHSGNQNGFAILNPWKATGATFSIINTSNPNTILWSTNEATGPNQTEFFAGWTSPAGGKSSGIVGICKVSHCGSTDGTARPRFPKHRQLGAHHD